MSSTARQTFQFRAQTVLSLALGFTYFEEILDCARLLEILLSPCEPSSDKAVGSSAKSPHSHAFLPLINIQHQGKFSS
jgi:hypothetical protein